MADKYDDKAKATRREAAEGICADKLAFPDKGSAKRHNKGQRSYRCSICGQWHNTSWKVQRAMPAPPWPRQSRKGRR